MIDDDQLALATGDPPLPPYAGVSTILAQTVYPGDRFLRWAWKLGSQRIGLTDQRAHERRSAGLELHRFYERLAEGGPQPPIGSLDPDVRGFAESLLRYWHRHQPRVLAVELSLRHPEHRISGRIDTLRSCDHPSGSPCGGAGVIAGDLKTGGSKGDPIDAKAARQVAGGYQILWSHQDGLPDHLRGRPWCGAEIIRVYEDGDEAEPYPLPDRRQGFLHALASYRDMELHGDLPQHEI